MNRMKSSNSNEFTYTSLGSSRPDDLDDVNVNEDQMPSEEKKKEIHIEAIDLSLNKGKDDPGTVSDQSDDSIKKLPFDEIIDRVKTNRIANKDICNYVLNLLVGGEFDLEKNFVIKNEKSIMHMIQVIKCAKPALKVEIELVIFCK